MTKYTVEAGSGWRATLDGKQVLYAQEAEDANGADGIAGYVIAPLVYPSGKPVFDHARNDYAIVRRWGKVAVTTGGMTPERRAFIAEDDNPFRLEAARRGELSADYYQNRFRGRS